MKRFYDKVTVGPAGKGWLVTLDGRRVRTARGAPQVVPSEKLAERLAREWRDQGDKIDPAAFSFRDHADYAIDIVAPHRDAGIAKLVAFAETDTLCYRADPEDALYRKQQEVWEPLVTALEAREGVSLQRVSGIVHKQQGAKTLATLRARLRCLDDFTLAGLTAMASLGASLCVALAALEEDADAGGLWAAANLEEDWQADLWGRDEEAEAVRAARKAEFRRAFDFAKVARTR